MLAYRTNFSNGDEVIQELLPNGYVATAGAVQETELNAQTEYCSAKHRNINIRSRTGTVYDSWQGAAWRTCI